MESLPTLIFSELDTKEECLLLLRAGSGQIALGLSRRSDGDIEVVMPLSVAQELHANLSRALAVARNAV